MRAIFSLALPHAGRPLRLEIRPLAAAALCAAILAVLAWSTAATGYILFRDEALREIVARHAARERAGKDEIARLKDEVARLSTLHSVERRATADRLEAMMRRHALLESRQAALDAVAGGAKADPAPPPRPATGRPKPLDDGAATGSTDPSLQHAPPAKSTAHAEKLSRLDRSQSELEAAQNAIAISIEKRVESERARFARVYAVLGLRLPGERLALASMGGPFLPIPAGGASDRFLSRLSDAEAELAALRAGLDRVPIRAPLARAEPTSGFGPRHDPFIRAIAFHAGVDLKAEPGTPVRTTAAGRVVEAGWNGGYGLSVEIDHGRGLVTRYAHLSAIMVSAGDTLAAGATIGTVGSTGRSTGPHLHYETRIGGEAVDPERFLQAGAELGS